ncbi:MAG: tetratricopeptide repeat protein [Bdellovibrionaceae bacterium]|nr:tetratricopeptide repeat protein [Bdellovibrionales bacterium]MCB9086215.1 tetratricopeptide repeat protein [Pseudobdellovibrionaceae bacterium]
MATGRQIATLGAIAMLAVSCGSLQRRGDEGNYKNSALSNLNPAPEAFQPPDMVDAENPVIDSVYLQSQSDYHYTMGESYSLEGNSEKAIEEFKLTLIYDPNSVMVRLRLSVEYVRQGLLSEAIEQAELAVKMDPKSSEGRLLLGGLYSSLKMYEVALKQYQTILEFEPKNEEARIYIGAILAEQKKFEESIQMFEELAKISDREKKFQAYYYIGRIRAEQGGQEHQAEAEKAFTKALSLNPKDPESVLALAKLYEVQEKPKKLLKLLESFQERFGPHPRVAQQLSNIYLENDNYKGAVKQLEYMEGFEPDDLSVKFRLGLLYVEMKDYEMAIDKFEKLLELEPESDRTRFYLGAVYEELKQFDQAVFHFKKVPASSSFFVDANIHSAYLLKLQSKFDESIEVMESAISQRDDVPQFYAFYASLLDDKRAYTKAVKMLTGAVEKFPTHTQLLFFLGSMHDRLGNFNETVSNMKKVIEIDGGHVQALNYLAYTYAEQNINLVEAEGLARKALGFQPKDGYILDTVGWVLFKQDRVAEAIPYLEAAYRVKSTESIIAEHLGDAYYKYELVDKARKMYLKAVDSETDEHKIRQIQDKIVAIDRQIEESKTRTPASSSSSSKTHAK